MISETFAIVTQLLGNSFVLLLSIATLEHVYILLIFSDAQLSSLWAMHINTACYDPLYMCVLNVLLMCVKFNNVVIACTIYIHKSSIRFIFVLLCICQKDIMITH